MKSGPGSVLGCKSLRTEGSGKVKILQKAQLISRQDFERVCIKKKVFVKHWTPTAAFCLMLPAGGSHRVCQLRRGGRLLLCHRGRCVCRSAHSEFRLLNFVLNCFSGFKRSTYRNNSPELRGLPCWFKPSHVGYLLWQPKLAEAALMENVLSQTWAISPRAGLDVQTRKA